MGTEEDDLIRLKALGNLASEAADDPHGQIRSPVMGTPQGRRNRTAFAAHMRIVSRRSIARSRQV
jgi:hypothetical protein